MSGYYGHPFGHPPPQYYYNPQDYYPHHFYPPPPPPIFNSQPSYIGSIPFFPYPHTSGFIVLPNNAAQPEQPQQYHDSQPMVNHHHYYHGGDYGHSNMDHQQGTRSNNHGHQESRSPPIRTSSPMHGNLIPFEVCRGVNDCSCSMCEERRFREQVQARLNHETRGMTDEERAAYAEERLSRPIEEVIAGLDLDHGVASRPEPVHHVNNVTHFHYHYPPAQTVWDNRPPIPQFTGPRVEEIENSPTPVISTRIKASPSPSRNNTDSVRALENECNHYSSPHKEDDWTAVTSPKENEEWDWGKVNKKPSKTNKKAAPATASPKDNDEFGWDAPKTPVTSEKLPLETDKKPNTNDWGAITSPKYKDEWDGNWGTPKSSAGTAEKKTFKAEKKPATKAKKEKKSATSTARTVDSPSVTWDRSGWYNEEEEEEVPPLASSHPTTTRTGCQWDTAEVMTGKKEVSWGAPEFIDMPAFVEDSARASEPAKTPSWDSPEEDANNNGGWNEPAQPKKNGRWNKVSAPSD